jgi:Lipase (class 3)
MPFTPLIGADGQPDPEALLEAATGIEACYDGGPADIQALVDACGGGVVHAYSRVAGALPPAYAVAQQGSNWYVWVAGTVNSVQLLNHAAGAAQVSELPDGSRINSFFQQMSSNLLGVLAGLLPDPSAGPTIQLSGHSYGAAVCQLASQALREIYPPTAVRFLGFGTPKSRDALWTGNIAGVNIRVVRNGDPVAVLPPSYGHGGLTWWGIVFAGRLGVGIPWRHYGLGYRLDDDGSVYPDGDDNQTGWLPTYRIQDLAVAQHLIRGVLDVLIGSG